MRLRTFCVAMWFLSTAAIAFAQTKTIDFDKDKVGQPPSGFSFGLTGTGKPGAWVIKKDEASPDRRNVLASAD